MNESKLSYLLSRLTSEQRDELIAKLGIGRDTFYRRRNRPGEFTLDEGAIIASYLEAIHDSDLDIYHLLNTQVDVLAEKTA